MKPFVMGETHRSGWPPQWPIFFGRRVSNPRSRLQARRLLCDFRSEAGPSFRRAAESRDELTPVRSTDKHQIFSPCRAIIAWRDARGYRVFAPSITLSRSARSAPGGSGGDPEPVPRETRTLPWQQRVEE